MSEIFFCSDTHFCHDKSFLYEPRGFSSVEEMNEKIIENWNKIVPKDGITFLLGDTMLNNNEKGIECLKRLNGEIFLIFGNHDTESRRNILLTECAHKVKGGLWAYTIKHNKFNFYLSHYPTLTSNMDDTGLWHRVISLHGHTHQKTNFLYPDNPFIYHVGVDSHNCYPVNIEEVIADIKNRYFEISKLGIERRPLYDFTKE